MSESVRHTTTDTYDVCVVGAGMAGICAAIAAARHGALTALVDDRPVIGGCSSTEIRVPPCGSAYFNPWATETGIIHELIIEDRVRNHDPINYGHANAIWDMVLYDACRREPNLHLHLNTCIDHVQMADDCHIAEVVGTQSHSGNRLHIPSRMFIDCSGDGCVGVGAGVPFRVGAETRDEYGEPLAPEQPDDFLMGSSLLFRARDTGHDVPFTPPDWAEVYDHPEGIPYRSTSDITGGYWWIEIGWPLDTLHDDPQIRDELLRHVFGVWDHIKNRGREQQRARTWALDWVGFVPARRESRRLVGAHVLTQQEIQRTEPFADAVAYGGWSIDDHTRGGIRALDRHPSFDSVRQADYFVTPYPVPLRSLYAEQVDNLFFAGRVLSASRIAFSSLRVQQSLATTGQAAGTAAAWCVHSDTRPHDITDPSPIQQLLLRDDCWIPGHAESNLARDSLGATATASSEATLDLQPSADGLALSTRPAAFIPISAERIDGVAVYLDNPGGVAELTVSIHPAENIWDLGALDTEPIAATTFRAPNGAAWADVALDIDGRPAPYWIRISGPEHITWRFSTTMSPGTSAAYDRPDGTCWFAGSGWAQWHCMAVQLTPPSAPFSASMAINGRARPEREPNLWMSAPDRPMPQWLCVNLPNPTAIDTAVLIFDTNLCRTNMTTPGLFRAPECVRDYILEAEVDGQWLKLARVEGNFHRRREHRFVPAVVSSVRLTVLATNGDTSARVYALGLYRRG